MKSIADEPVTKAPPGYIGVAGMVVARLGSEVVGLFSILATATEEQSRKLARFFEEQDHSRCHFVIRKRTRLPRAAALQHPIEPYSSRDSFLGK